MPQPAGAPAAETTGQAAPAPPQRGTASLLRLHVLTAGPIPPNPGEMVTSEQLSGILAALRDAHDYVLVDAPPMFVVGDASALAGRVDGIVVVLRYDQTTANTLNAVADFVQRVPTRTLGVVVTAAPRKTRGGAYRYAEYYE